MEKTNVLEADAAMLGMTEEEFLKEIKQSQYVEDSSGYLADIYNPNELDDIMLSMDTIIAEMDLTPVEDMSITLADIEEVVPTKDEATDFMKEALDKIAESDLASEDMAKMMENLKISVNAINKAYTEYENENIDAETYAEVMNKANTIIENIIDSADLDINSKDIINNAKYCDIEAIQEYEIDSGMELD